MLRFLDAGNVVDVVEMYVAMYVYISNVAQWGGFEDWREYQTRAGEDEAGFTYINKCIHYLDRLRWYVDRDGVAPVLLGT